MCQFNLAIVDSDSDDLKLKEIFEQHGLYFSLIKNSNLDKYIGSDLKAIFTTRSSCDCGSVIGYDSIDNSSKRDIEKEINKLKRKKWSDSKIKRYLENKEKNELKKQSEKSETLGEELKKWSDTINDCIDSSISKRFGILTHFYSGALEEEKFDNVEILKSKLNDFKPESLRKLEFDKILLLS